MSYADGLLSTGEWIIHRERQHPFILIRGARWTILAVVLGSMLLWIGSNIGTEGIAGGVRSMLLWITAFMYLAGLVVFAWTALRHVSREYVLTDRRVLEVEGVLNRHATDSSLEKINDAVLRQSLFGRLFGYGDLRILTAADAGIEDFRMIRDPVTFKKAMLDAKQGYDLGMERAGLAPAPPIRMPPAAGTADAAGVAQGIGAAAAGVAYAAGLEDTTAVSRSLSPDEIIRTLHNLADLRDRGAISEAEYDAKKADLLARL